MAKEDQCAAHLLVQVRSFRVPFFYNFAEAVNVGDYDGVKSDENWRKKFASFIFNDDSTYYVCNGKPTAFFICLLFSTYNYLMNKYTSINDFDFQWLQMDNLFSLATSHNSNGVDFEQHLLISSEEYKL